MSWGSIAGAVAGAGLDLFKDHQTISHADFWNRQNIALQKEFAQNSIKWRVEDAKRAGVHPMAALGIQPASFSPVSSSLGLTSGTGDYLADMGQNIDRAIMAGKDAEARKQAETDNKAISAANVTKSQADARYANAQADLAEMEVNSRRAARNTAATPAAPPTSPEKVTPLGSETPSPSPAPKTGMISRKDAAFHIWHMGNGEFDINFNPDYTQTMGDELGQFVNAYHNAKRDRLWIDPDTGTLYVYNPNSGYFNLVTDLSPEEFRELLGEDLPNPRDFDSDKYARTFYVGY